MVINTDQIKKIDLTKTPTIHDFVEEAENDEKKLSDVLANYPLDKLSPYYLRRIEDNTMCAIGVALDEIGYFKNDKLYSKARSTVKVIPEYWKRKLEKVWNLTNDEQGRVESIFDINWNSALEENRISHSRLLNYNSFLTPETRNMVAKSAIDAVVKYLRSIGK